MYLRAAILLPVPQVFSFTTFIHIFEPSALSVKMAHRDHSALPFYDIGLELDLDFDENQLTTYHDASVNVEQILQELVKRNEAVNGPRKSRKRKADVSNSVASLHSDVI